MKNKNILIVSPTKVGLTETFIKAHIDNLDGTIFYLYGYDLDFKTVSDVPLEDFYRPKSTLNDKLLNILPHFVWFRIHAKKKEQFKRENLIKKYLTEHQIDVVLAEYGTSGSFMSPICRELKVPLIVHFHGFDASKYQILELFKDGYQEMFQYGQNIIVVSNAMKKALIDQGCPEDKLVLNTYGPHPDYMEISVNYESNQIVAVGRHTYKKAPYLTILAFQEVLKSYPEMKLMMIGDGELFEVSKNMVDSLGLTNHVTLPGGLERQEIIKHLSQSFMFVQHSLVAGDGDSEGTPVGIIEAMSAGLPIVSTRHAGIPDVVLDGETGYLVNEGEVKEMAERMMRLIKDRGVAKSFGEQGKKRILSNFTMENHLKVINDIIADLK